MYGEKIAYLKAITIKNLLSSNASKDIKIHMKNTITCLYVFLLWTKTNFHYLEFQRSYVDHIVKHVNIGNKILNIPINFLNKSVPLFCKPCSLATFCFELDFKNNILLLLFIFYEIDYLPNTLFFYAIFICIKITQHLDCERCFVKLSVRQTEISKADYYIN